MEIDLNTRGKRPKFFENAETEVLMTALLETMSELWATRERLLALERVLQDAGLVAGGAVDGHAFSKEDEAGLANNRQAFLTDAFRGLAAEFQTLDERAADVQAFQKDPGDADA